MKVIFVDIDGPLAWGTLNEDKVQINSELKLPYPWVKEECDALTQIINSTGAKVVISSDWKKHYSLQELGQIFEFYGIPNVIIDKTSTRKAKLSSISEWDRAIQIMDWVREHNTEIKSWIALDDIPVAKYFGDQTEEYPYITKENHIWLDGECSQPDARLCQNVKKIIEFLNKTK